MKKKYFDEKGFVGCCYVKTLSWMGLKWMDGPHP